MSKVIIFKQDGGRLSVIYPVSDAVTAYGIEAVARKDVPPGKPFRIIDSKDLPPRDQRDGWTVDDAVLIDGVGSDSNEFEVGT